MSFDFDIVKDMCAKRSLCQPTGESPVSVTDLSRALYGTRHEIRVTGLMKPGGKNEQAVMREGHGGFGKERGR